MDKISIVWSIEDVKEIAPELTDDQCRQVLKRALDDHDATIGINWDVLQSYVDEIKGETVYLS